MKNWNNRTHEEALRRRREKEAQKHRRLIKHYDTTCDIDNNPSNVLSTATESSILNYCEYDYIL